MKTRGTTDVWLLMLGWLVVVGFWGVHPTEVAQMYDHCCWVGWLVGCWLWGGISDLGISALCIYTTSYI